MAWHNNLKIRGISGWNDAERGASKVSVVMEALTEDTSTPEERLAALQKNLREGGEIVQAPAETGGFVVQWSSDKGFGELTFVMRKDGTIRIDNEGDSKAVILEVMAALVRQSTLADEPDPSLQH